MIALEKILHFCASTPGHHETALTAYLYKSSSADTG